MNSKSIFLSVALLLITCLVSAQFSKAQKDSVLNYLDFPRAAYELRMDYQPNAYLNTPPNRLSRFPEAVLSSKLDNSTNDALVYAEMAARIIAREGRTPESDEFLRQSVAKYEAWLAQDPSNEEAMVGLMGGATKLGDFEKMVSFLNPAVELAPKNMELLKSVIYFYLFGGQSFELCQEFVSQALAIEPYNIEVLTYQHSLNEFMFFRGMEDGSVKELDINAIAQAYNANKTSTAHQHLYHFARVSQVYTRGMHYFIAQPKKSKDVFRNFGLNSEDFGVIKEALEAFESILKLDFNNKDMLLNSIGFSHALLGDYASAESSFTNQYKTKGGDAGLESLAVLYAFQDKWAEAAEAIERKVKVSNSIEDYGSLLKVYHVYLKNEEKAKLILPQIEKSPYNGPVKSQLLCTWFLKKRDIASAEKYIESAALTSDGWKQKLALSVLKDNKQDAKTAIYPYATNKQASPEYVALNKYLGL